jgi:sugar lactone lactonase YvrE
MRVNKTLCSSVLLWFRQDLNRDAVRAHWRGPHAQLVARSPAFQEYRQHHFLPSGDGAWPLVTGVETIIPNDRRVDGMPEVMLKGLFAALKPNKQQPLIFADEANAFSRTILYATAPNGCHKYDLSSRGRIGSRVVVLLRRRIGVKRKQFDAFVNQQLARRLTSEGSLRELHIQVFMPWKQKQWDSPGVAHDNPPELEFHAALFLGFANDEERDAFFRSENIENAADEVAQNCSAVHAYHVEKTHIYVHQGRVTLPQVYPVAKPQIEPMRRVLPPPPDRAAQCVSNVSFPAARVITLSGEGAEDVVADSSGRLICGLADGRIVRVDPASRIEDTIGHTGGRPLGLEMLRDGRILICDAQRGLLRLDPADGQIEILVQDVDDIPLRFCSNVTAAADGTYWFTESTSRFDFEDYIGAMLEHRPSGRLLRRDPDGKVEVVLEALHFANGLTLTDEDESLIFAETDGYRLTRMWLKGPKAGQCEIIADNLPGFPDNMSRMQDGHFWVAIPNARNAALDKAGKLPGLLRKLAWRNSTTAVPSETTWVMGFSPDGRVLADYQMSRADFAGATGVTATGGKLYLVSVEANGILEIDLPHDPVL